MSGENDQDYRWQELPDTTRSFGNLRFFPFLITRAPSPPAGTEIFTITDPIIASSRTQTPATLGPELIGLEFTVRAADNIITLPQQFIPTGVREVQSVPLRKRYAIQLDSNTSATLGASDLYFDYELVTIDPAKPNEKRIGISYKTTVGNLALQRINRILGARGPQGFTGPTSTTPGPRGPIGPQSTIPGPRGPQGPIFRPTIQNLYIPIKEIFKAGDQIVLARNEAKRTITINATPPEGGTGNFVFTTLSPASGSPTTQQTFNVTADQNIFSILLTTSNAGAGSGTYPRFWIRRSELLSSNKRYVSDTHNPTATDDKTIAIDVNIVSSILTVAVVAPAGRTTVTISEVSSVKVERGPKGDPGDPSTVPGPPGPQGLQGIQTPGMAQGVEIARCVVTVAESQSVTKSDWTLTRDSIGNAFSGTRLSLRNSSPTQASRNLMGRVGYLFRLRATIGGNETTVSEGMLLYGQPEKITFGLLASLPQGTVRSGALDLNVSYGREGFFIDVDFAATAIIDSIWQSTPNLRESYTVSVHELLVTGPKGDPGPGTPLVLSQEDYDALPFVQQNTLYYTT